MEELAQGLRESGVPVLVKVSGTRADVPPGVDLCAFRIVQEALTNVLKHAGPARAEVDVDYRPGTVAVTITDDGRGAAAATVTKGGGNGLLGMRERVAVFGGQLTTGPQRGRRLPGGGHPALRHPALGASAVPRRGRRDRHRHRQRQLITVLVADDQTLVRAGFRVLVDSAPDCRVVAEAANGVEAVDLAAEHRPDVVLMDVRMPELDGIGATRAIVGDERLTETRVIVLTTFDLDEYVFDALRAGASGFLLKDTDPADLLAAVRVVAGGEALLSPRITGRVIAEFASRPGRPRAERTRELDQLTEREREVLVQVGRGLSNAEIAAELYVSAATAKTHVSRIMMKLAARDRVQLVVLAYESGLVTPGSD